MKNKKLAVLLTILVFFAVVVVLSSTVFSLGGVSLKFHSTTSVLTGQETQILESGNFKYGENVFFSSKKAYKNALEKANPYLKVLNIETVFPNKFIVNAVERNETYVFKMNNNKYYITDESLKILKILDEFQNNTTNAIVVNNSGLTSQTQLVEGNFFAVENNFYSVLFDCFREWDTSYVSLKSKIESIEMDYNNYADRLLVNMRSGVQIIVRNAKSSLSNKLNLAFSFYDTDTINGQPVDYTKSGIIEVFENEDKIYASYRQV